MDNRSISEKYQKIAEDLIASEPTLRDIYESDVRIIYLSSGHKKTNAGGIVYGQCEKIADKYKWGIPCDFTVTIFEPNVRDARFTDEQIRALLHHELLHVGIEREETLIGAEEKYFIVPHDLEDFRFILETYGVNYSKPN